MKRIFTLLLLPLPSLVVNAQSVTDSVQVKTDTVSFAVTPVPVDTANTVVVAPEAIAVQEVTTNIADDTVVAAETPVKNTIAEVPTMMIAAEPQKAEAVVKQENAVASELFRKNIIKMNVTSLLFNNYNFTYERSIRRKMTLSLGYRFMPKSAFSEVPLFKKGIEIADEAGAFEDSEDFNIKEEMDNIFMSNTAFTGELRFYTGKKAGARGFYVSLYGRYTDMSFNYDYEYEGETKTYDMPISISTKGYGGGVMFGAQWLIAKRVTLDWNILGAHFGKMTGTADGTADLRDMPAAERRDLEEDLESIGEVGNKRYLEVNVTDNGINAKANGPFAGLRSGFTLGIAF